MKTIGKVHAICGVVEGATEKGAWKRQTIVVEIGERERKIAIDYNSDEMIERIKSIGIGDLVEVEWSPESRQSAIDPYRWYTSIHGWVIRRYEKA